MRADELVTKSKMSEMAINKAVSIGRNSGNFPALLAELMVLDGGLTEQELEAIETAWKVV